MPHVNLADPVRLKEFLQAHGIGAKKALGQHFLISSRAVNAIVATAADCASVLEIGPGPGILTGPLTETCAVSALEIDERMPALLADSAPEARILAGDALQIDLRAVLEGLSEPRAIVSNLPYYITGPLLQRIAEVRDRIAFATLMMQREVANRILATPGHTDRGAVSAVLQGQFQISLVAQVPAGAFMPPPKVDSTVLKFTPRSDGIDDETVRLIHFGFTQRRKTLANNLSAGYRLDRTATGAWLESCGIPPMTRAQELDEASWRCLSAARPELTPDR